jgi:hypothetical protein
MKKAGQPALVAEALQLCQECSVRDAPPVSRQRARRTTKKAEKRDGSRAV